MQKLTGSHEFIVLACDGIWDVLSNEEVLEFVRTRIAQQIPPETVSVCSGHSDTSLFNAVITSKLYV